MIAMLKSEQNAMESIGKAAKIVAELGVENLD